MASSSETRSGSPRSPKRRRQRRGNSSSGDNPSSTSRSGQRRSGGGSRRRQGGDPQRSKSASASPTASAPPKKPGLLSRLLGALGLGGASASAASAAEKRRRGEPKRVPRKRAATVETPAARDRDESGEGRRKAPRGERSKRPPEHVEVTNPRLYVGNLSYDATESDLMELFSGVGQVQSAEVVSNRHTHRSKGFAFVEMLSIDEARRAVEVLHDQEFMGRKLVVTGAKSEGSKGDDAESAA